MRISGRVLGIALIGATLLSGCARRESDIVVASSDLDCLSRAMYFESNRSSRDGMVAVGSVVMNRVASEQFPSGVCAVVGQPRQFAPGVLTKEMTEPASLERVREAAASVLAGERHPNVGNAMFFHQAGLRFPYDNMHYTVTTGGNAFYEKRKSNLVTQPVPVSATEGLTSGEIATEGWTPIEVLAPAKGIWARLWG